jgi:beta-lactamase regulating signal transducer with metallopeptidase domain
MQSLLHLLPFLSAAATGALFSAIWEGSVLAVCVVLALRLLPGLSAAARSVVWLNIFILLALLHVLPTFGVRATSGLGSHLASVHLDMRWSLAIATVWVALSVWRGTQLILGAIHLHRLARRATPIDADSEMQALLHDAPAGRTAQLCTSAEVARPSVLGFFGPRVLLPPTLVERLSALELQQVVLHEMEHLRRADDWTNLLQKIGLVLFPLNPVLVWVERRLCAERELACDDRVLRSSAGRKAYALCLTHLAEYSILQRSLSLVLGAWERRPELVRRVQRILRQPGHSMGRKPAMAATAGLMAGALGCTLALAHCPQLVSFVPAALAPSQARTMAPKDLRELGRELGGTPQLLKAVMPQEPHRPAYKPVPVRPKSAKPAPQRNMMAQLQATEQLPALNPAQVPEQGTLVVLTEWSYTDTPAPAVPARVMIRVADGQRLGYMVVPARYAAVRTPVGWLIMQI